MRMITVESLVDECRGVIAQPDAEHVVAAYVSRLFCDHSSEVAALLGDSPDSAVLHRGDDLTIVKVVMPPLYMFQPHNHLMWGVVGTVTGREDNTFFVRDGDHITPAAGASYEAGQVGVLGKDVIHA